MFLLVMAVTSMLVTAIHAFLRHAGFGGCCATAGAARDRAVRDASLTY
ncbi:MAG TPA: hypothetical protein VGA15_17555 [Bradyrhizobium sp.]